MWLAWAVAVLCVTQILAEWQCPALSRRPAAECSCDLPHTLRCAGDHTALQIIGRHLREQKARNKNSAVSLLDCALRGVSALSSASMSDLAGVGLHGLVISSGDIRRIQQNAFGAVASTLIALGLPNNQLPSVPTEAINKLRILDRLDLSNNKIYILDATSFKGIQNLTYLDMSDNQLTSISPDAFKPLVRLAILRLRGNLLKVSALASLKEAHMLRDLDLSSNALEGPLGPTTVPPLSQLTTLQLSDNTFASIRRGALAGLPNLMQLNLHNNQIDVLEDYAFRHLVNLTHLDLSHNEIVAVSGASLAQLTNLYRLDLSHNFLRSLSAEPLKSLRGLGELLLDDNDISMIDDGALAQHKQLKRFTIEDNPLNCDCLMASFAKWLREADKLPQSDKSAAMCMTPPHLEGALLFTLSKNKLCDDFDHADTVVERDDTYVDAYIGRLDTVVDSHIERDEPKHKVISSSNVRSTLDEVTNIVSNGANIDAEKALNENKNNDEITNIVNTDAENKEQDNKKVNKMVKSSSEVSDVSNVDKNLEIINSMASSSVTKSNPIIENIDSEDATDDASVYADKLGLQDDLYDEEIDVPGEDDLPISKIKVELIDAWYDDEEVHLSWTLDAPSNHRSRCVGVTVSRSGGLPKHVACHRAPPDNIVLRGLKIAPNDLYTFCVALEEMDKAGTPLSLVLGCGKPQLVRERATFATAAPVKVTAPVNVPITAPEIVPVNVAATLPTVTDNLRVSEVRSNITSDGTLSVIASVSNLPIHNVLSRIHGITADFPNCYVVIVVLSRGKLVAQKDTPCEPTLEISMDGFVRGPYEVCASLSKYKINEMHPICVTPQLQESINTIEMKVGIKSLNTILIGIASGMLVMIVGLTWLVKKMTKKPTEFEPQHYIRFRRDPVPEETQRANYVVLTAAATSKV